MNAAVAEILRGEASGGETIVGRTYRHRASGRVYVVTGVVRQHRHGGVAIVEADGAADGEVVCGKVEASDGIKVVLDGRLHVSPGAFVRHWVEAAGHREEVGP